MNGIDAIYPDTYAGFLVRTARLARTDHVPLVDLHRRLVAAAADWSDPSHLNRVGAAAFGTVLARALASHVP